MITMSIMDIGPGFILVMDSGRRTANMKPAEMISLATYAVVPRALARASGRSSTATAEAWPDAAMRAANATIAAMRPRARNLFHFAILETS